VTIPPAPREPTSWRDAARRLVARLRPGRGAGVGSSEGAEFDAAARRAYQAALKLDDGMSLAPAPPRARPAETPGPVPESRGAFDEPEPQEGSDESALAVTPNQPLGPPATAVRESDERATEAPGREQLGYTSPDPLLRTRPGVDSVADDFFDSLIRRIEGDR
jgi:hypothetical protein